MARVDEMTKIVVDEIERRGDKSAFAGFEKPAMFDMVREVLDVWEGDGNCRKRYNRSVSDRDLRHFVEDFVLPTFGELNIRKAAGWTG